MRPAIDHGRTVDWGATSADYAVFRPGPPDELYDRLRKLRIGLPGQRMLDLGTGTGVMARAFSRRGADVAGIDIAPEQIDEARRLASAAQLAIDFRVAPAEEPPFAVQSFEVASANQCFLYFDRERVFAALRRVLVPGGRLVISHFSWLPKIDSIAAASEELVLKFNPLWLSAGFDGEVAPEADWRPADVPKSAFSGLMSTYPLIGRLGAVAFAHRVALVHLCRPRKSKPSTRNTRHSWTGLHPACSR